MTKNVQLDYGPINTLLKFKEGVDAGLTVIQIAKNLYGGDEKKIQDGNFLNTDILKYFWFI